MFRVGIHLVEMADAAAVSAADEVGTSSSGTSKLISPRLSNSLPSTTSSGSPLELSGVASRNPKIRHTLGVLHLYRSSAVAGTPSSSTARPLPRNATLPQWRSTRLLVLAVPIRLSEDKFVESCPYIENVAEVHFIRNNCVEDRYSVLLDFEDQKSADRFYLGYSGSKFSSSEVSHIMFIAALDYMPASEIVLIPPAQSTELPTCPVCITRLDHRIGANNCDHTVNCSCFTVWAHSSCQVCKFCLKQSQAQVNPSKCSVCKTSEDVWICILCGFLGCGRYEEGHSLQHWNDTQHCWSLHLDTKRIWNYVGDSYVKQVKFTACEYSQEKKLNRKAQAMADDKIIPVVAKLASQHKYYEALLSAALKEREQIAPLAAKAVNDKRQEMELKLQNLKLEIKEAAKLNEKLVKTDDICRKTVETIEEKEKAQLQLKEAWINDLEEQIRDIKYNIKLGNRIKNSPCADEIKGGRLVALEIESHSARGKRSTKSKRKK